MNRLSTKQFDWDRFHRLMTAEASDLAVNPLEQNIEVASDKTGAVLVFEYMMTIRDREGEVLRWEYRNAPQNIRIFIYND